MSETTETPARTEAGLALEMAMQFHPHYEVSPSIAHFAEALAKAQGEITNAEKDRTNPHFGQKYATLAANLDSCRMPLSKNGIAVVQIPHAEGQQVTVHTVLIHKSGEWLRFPLTLQARDGSPQATGSAITYARRYSLSSVVGIAPDDDDDDGNAAQKGWESQRRQQIAKGGGDSPREGHGQHPAEQEEQTAIAPDAEKLQQVVAQWVASIEGAETPKRLKSLGAALSKMAEPIRNHPDVRKAYDARDQYLANADAKEMS